MAGGKTIEAVQFETDPEPDYVDVPLEELPYDEPWQTLDQNFMHQR